MNVAQTADRDYSSLILRRLKLSFSFLLSAVLFRISNRQYPLLWRLDRISKQNQSTSCKSVGENVILFIIGMIFLPCNVLVRSRQFRCLIVCYLEPERHQTTLWGWRAAHSHSARARLLNLHYTVCRAKCILGCWGIIADFKLLLVTN